MTNTAIPRLRYDEGCLAAHALNLVGDRWALLVVRELMFTGKRFQMIRAGLPGITASVLTARLAQLQQARILVHDERLGLYVLTDAGLALRPVLESLCRWALEVPGHDPQRFISPSALMISMGVTLQPRPRLRSIVRAGFDFGHEVFDSELAGTRLHTIAASASQAPCVLAGTGNALARAVYGAQPLARLLDEGVIRLDGDAAAAQAFVDRFALGPPAATP